MLIRYQLINISQEQHMLSIGYVARIQKIYMRTSCVVQITSFRRSFPCVGCVEFCDYFSGSEFDNVKMCGNLASVFRDSNTTIVGD
jgi:hypothetical protein